ncbi:hypothetical protein BX286_5947 [Streptomyces sp. 3211.6]|uniref:hypothetical protein n=1 Tax=Streptomyces TaxID=1883 RepID=UPI000C2BFF13|nr:MULTISPECIES: hypothetical protein [Streptomyces]RKT07874.1 hypothetical protein BX286_5947 [Streptomyces sp. 3211.6]RPF44504.1 hypothetical protein EDD96_1036 [Streptomyces sp. Ag109_G2-6]
MDEQGGAGGVPLHDDDGQQRRKPHARRGTAGDPGRKSPGPVRREDTDEASRLDRPGTPDPADPRKQRGHAHGHG